MSNVKYLLLSLFFLTFITCKKDLCEDVDCQNGGICNEGICACPDHFSGTNCNEEEAPIHINVRRITLEKFPEKKLNGSTWDSPPGIDPEVIIKITRLDTVVWESPAVLNCVAPHTFYNLPRIYFETPERKYKLFIEDRDSPILGNDIIFAAEFYPYEEGAAFPNPYIIEDQRVKIVFEEMTYEW